MSVRLISVTPDAEKTMIYIARVSSAWQDNPDFAGLLRRCIRMGHSSVFEHAHMSVEIYTSRMISPQILRHWSARFQEFSQRYAEVKDYEQYEARRQDSKDRQNSIDDLSEEVKSEWRERQHQNWLFAKANYDWAIENHIAKECARAVLPLQTSTRLYMTMNCRDWMSFLRQRTDPSAQKEIREIAEGIKTIFTEQFPTVSEALGWPA
ncbi:MAG: FAD-dependent thymidylate synthase [Fluviibacter sp.]